MMTPDQAHELIKGWLINHDAVYSNFDHTTDHKVEKWLVEAPERAAMHAAWDFCGWIFRHDNQWHDLIMCHGCAIDLISGESIEEVVREVISRYGSR